MDLLGDGRLHVLQHLDLEERPEEVPEKEAGRVHALIRIRVSVVIVDALVGHPQETSRHVRQEARLLIGVVEAADVRIELIAEEVLDGHVACRLPRPDVEVLLHPEEGILLCEYGRCLHDGLNHDGLEDLVLVIPENHTDNDLVLENSEGSEEDEEGNLGLHPGNGRTEIHNLLILGVVLDSDGVRLGYLLVHWADGLDLDHLPLFCGIAVVSEDDGAILGHSLLGDNGTLTATDDKVAADILGTLAEVERCHVLLVLEKTEAAADHDGNLAEMGVGEGALMGRLAAIMVVGTGRRHLDVDSEGRGIGEITQPGVIGEHWKNSAVVLEDGRLTELGIEKLDLDLVLVADRGTEGQSSRCVGCRYGGIFGGLSHERIGCGRGETGGGCENGPGA